MCVPEAERCSPESPMDMLYSFRGSLWKAQIVAVSPVNRWTQTGGQVATDEKKGQNKTQFAR
jgi:hypothetical protein